MTTITGTDRIDSRTRTVTKAPAQRRSLTVAGWILTGFGGAFMIFDGVNHVAVSRSVRAGANSLGMDPAVFLPIGIIQLVFVGLYLVPRTATFGAILLTAFLGGAVCSNVIAGQPFFGYVMSGVYTAVILWFGVWLRTPALRRLVPFRR